MDLVQILQIPPQCPKHWVDEDRLRVLLVNCGAAIAHHPSPHLRQHGVKLLRHRDNNRRSATSSTGSLMVILDSAGILVIWKTYKGSSTSASIPHHEIESITPLHATYAAGHEQ